MSLTDQSSLETARTSQTRVSSSFSRCHDIVYAKEGISVGRDVHVLVRDADIEDAAFPSDSRKSNQCLNLLLVMSFTRDMHFSKTSVTVLPPSVLRVIVLFFMLSPFQLSTECLTVFRYR